MAGLFEGRAKEEALPFPPQKKSITAPPVMMEGKMEIGLKKKSRIGLKFLFRWKMITIEFALLFSNSDTKETIAVF